MTKIRVMIVEDDAAVRAELGRLVEASRELALVGLHATAESALEAVRRGLRVDVALTDLRLPGMSGSELIAKLRTSHREVEIVVLTIYEDDDSLYGALRAGASGYLLKDASLAEATEAVRQVHQGGAPMSPSIARRVLLEFRRPPRRRALAHHGARARGARAAHQGRLVPVDRRDARHLHEHRADAYPRDLP